MTVLPRRYLKCLQRVDANKSAPDFDAFCWLVEKGYIRSVAHPDGDGLAVSITDAGRAALGQP